MPRETFKTKASRTRRIIAGLKKAYPDAHCELNHSNPLELLIATILSAQCTDKRVNIVTADLFRNYRSAADFANVDLAQLEKEIKTTGFYRNKARSIKACCQSIVEKHGGKVPRKMEELLELGGVGRKTANVVLGNAFDVNVGIVVDTHVARLSQRLALTVEKDPVKIEQNLMKLVPQEQWTLFSHLLIWHGRRRCTARNPDCPSCEVLSLCPRIGVASAEQRRAGKAAGEHEVSSFLLLESGPGDAAFNMALDEALLEAMPRLQKPVLRFYGWNEPAASFGYFQKYRDVERRTLLCHLVRRPTGGGVVPHDYDWTYSLIFPPGHEWYSLRAVESYRRVHEWIRAAFAKLNVSTRLAAERKNAEPGQCFAGHERFDVLWHWRKIAGAAQRRNRFGLLIQGSVLPPAGFRLNRKHWEKAMRDVGPPGICIDWIPFAPDAALRERAEELARLKYSQRSYNQKR